MDKVDPMYIFNSEESLIDLSSDTRLKFSSQEVTDWLKDACMSITYCLIFVSLFPYLFLMYSEKLQSAQVFFSMLVFNIVLSSCCYYTCFHQTYKEA